VTVRVNIDNKPFVGRAVSTDVIIASAKAYLDAVNRSLYMRAKKKNGNQKKTAAKRPVKKTVAK
jgi:2-isopropylmalate synthase